MHSTDTWLVGYQALSKININNCCKIIVLPGIYLSRDDTPRIKDRAVRFDTENGWLDHAPRILADFMVEVLVLSARSSSNERLNVALLCHVVAKLVGVVGIALCRQSKEYYAINNRQLHLFIVTILASYLYVP